MDFYKVLGVGRKASSAEIKAAYRKIAMKLHPDIAGKEARTIERFAHATQAYETLSNEKSRVDYDRSFLGYHSGNSGGAVSSRQTAYSPAGHARRTAANPGSAKAVKYNLQEWEALHYGKEDQPRVEGARQQNSWMDGLKGNRHQGYYRRKAARASQQEQQATINNNNNNPDIRNEEMYQTQVSENLRMQREARREGRRGGDDGCIVC